MKSFLLKTSTLLIILLLAGAGCSSTNDNQTNTDESAEQSSTTTSSEGKWNVDNIMTISVLADFQIKKTNNPGVTFVLIADGNIDNLTDETKGIALALIENPEITFEELIPNDTDLENTRSIGGIDFVIREIPEGIEYFGILDEEAGKFVTVSPSTMNHSDIETMIDSIIFSPSESDLSDAQELE